MKGTRGVQAGFGLRCGFGLVLVVVLVLVLAGGFFAFAVAFAVSVAKRLAGITIAHQGQGAQIGLCHRLASASASGTASIVADSSNAARGSAHARA